MYPARLLYKAVQKPRSTIRPESTNNRKVRSAPSPDDASLCHHTSASRRVSVSTAIRRVLRQSCKQSRIKAGIASSPDIRALALRQQRLESSGDTGPVTGACSPSASNVLYADLFVETSLAPLKCVDRALFLRRAGKLR